MRLPSRTSFLAAARNLLWAAADVIALTLILSTLAGFLGRLWWVFDLFSHFRVQYLAGLLILLPAYVIGRRRGQALVAVAAASNLLLIAPLYLPAVQPAIDGKTYQLWYANIHTESTNHAPARHRIEQVAPDIVALVEPNQKWLDDLHLNDLYPYGVEIPREDNFGVALYARWPIHDYTTMDFTGLGLPTLIAQLESPNGPLTLIVTHTVPPKGELATLARDIHMERMAAYVGQLDDPVILVGDLNATSWTPRFRGWLHTMGLRDSRRGFGVQSSWPTFAWFLRVPIDHILVSPEIRVRQRFIGDDIDSDHLPVILKFSLPTR